MTLGDLLSGLQAKVGGMFSPSPAPAPTTQNLAGLQARYQMYAADEMSAGRQPLPFKDWVIQQQLQQQ